MVKRRAWPCGAPCDGLLLRSSAGEVVHSPAVRSSITVVLREPTGAAGRGGIGEALGKRPAHAAAMSEANTGKTPM